MTFECTSSILIPLGDCFHVSMAVYAHHVTYRRTDESYVANPLRSSNIQYHCSELPPVNLERVRRCSLEQTRPSNADRGKPCRAPRSQTPGCERALEEDRMALPPGNSAQMMHSVSRVEEKLSIACSTN